MAVTYNCPKCGAVVEYDPKSQKMHCAFCGEYFNVGEYDNANADKYQRENDNGTTKSYTCKSCGAQLITDEHTSATICAFCGNATLVDDRLDGQFEPDSVIPFKIDKENAKQLVKSWMKKGILTPSSLKSDSVIDKITGVYVPFWLYNYDCSDDMTAMATRTRTSRDSNYIYTYTDHFRVERFVEADFAKIPADASEKMPDDIMDKLEPFDFKEEKPFRMPYLSGYLSEKYNYTATEIQGRTQTRARDYITQITRDTINGYATVNVINNNVNCVKTKEEYALLPVWILNYNWNNENHKLYMNGQTGKIVADRPVSTPKTIGAFVIVLVVAFIATLFF